ncbi:MAG TPA: integrin alpha [Chitinophagaceae bacterium]|nr:integrin alpha [Chitinophagaceae bacterium]
MKVTLPLTLAFLLFAFFSVNTYSQRPAQLPENVSAEWFAAATGHIEQSQYAIRNRGGNTFSIANNGQQLVFTISEKGYRVSPLRTGGWQMEASLETIAGQPCSKDFRWLHNGNRLVQQAQHYDVEYIHSAAGLRQNFIIKEKNGLLRVSLRISTSLSVHAYDDHALFFTNTSTGKEALRYSGLKVWDATGQVLPARIRFEQHSNLLIIEADDKDAVYPVTIDPLNHNPEWTSSADGVIPALLNDLQLQVEGLHGFTVASLGDINNDGYDDVAISAPALADVVSGDGTLAGVGAVFVYTGSPTGLGAQPAYVLQPNTAVANALFGFSVAGGDVTGDGINDIIVGAPLDQATVDFGAGQLIDGTVGRIYIYQGGASLSGPFPAPLLSLHLQSPLLTTTTIAINPLFGFSLAVADDMNGDGRGEIIVGAPTYARMDGISAVKTGGAFVFMSNATNTFTTVRSLNPPTGSVLNLLSVVQSIVEPIVGSLVWNLTLSPLLSPLLAGQINGLLFGYSVDGAGAYNSGDVHNDVVVGAPAGVDLGSLNAVLNGQILGGTAWVFTSTGTDINTTAAARLEASSAGLLSNAANLFGYRVKGRRNISGGRDGGLFVTAPAGAVLSNIVGGLQLNAGQVLVFPKRTAAITNPVLPAQTISSPRAASLLSILSGESLNLTLLFGGSIDNMTDANCDGYGDIIVGEPLSSAVGMIGADVVGGAAYVFQGRADGTYDPVPVYTLHAEVSPLLGVNATGLIGFSVAGAGRIQGGSTPVRPLVGAPANSLDFGAGLLNLGNTVSVLSSFTFDNNGLGNSFTFNTGLCGDITLPATLLSFTGRLQHEQALLAWKVAEERGVNYYELERSNDNREYRPIAMLFARNETGSSYTYTDAKPGNGINYYRLKIVDNDGRVEYSATVIIRLQVAASATLTAGPNPFKQQVHLRMQGYSPGVYEVRMTGPSGQTFMQQKISVTGFDYQSTIKAPPGLSAGVYWLNILGPDGEKAGAVALVLAGQ